MSVITLNVDETKRLVDGALAASSKDDVTPVLRGAQLTRTVDGRVSMVATDRYRVHRMFTDDVGPAPHIAPGGYPTWDEVETVVPHAGLKWLSANARKLGYFATVWITVDPHEDMGHPGSILIEVRAGLPNSQGLEMDRADGYLAYACRPVAGTYPPAHKWFGTLEDPEEVSPKGLLLEADFLADLRVLKRSPGRRGEPVRMRASKPHVGGRPNAVRFEFSHEGKVYADALIMPNRDLG
jgi:hypothetical protein